MSWLYSLVFAGLIFSSDQTPPSSIINLAQADTPAVSSTIADETERFEQSYPISPTGRVSVSNVNGSIVVEAWDRNEIKLEAVKVADNKETLADVEIKVDSRPDIFSVEADYGTWKRERDGGWKNNRRLEVHFRLSVPRTAVLNEIETVNGSVTVSNFTNFTKISAVNGNVGATNLRGTAELSTVNGEVTAEFEQLAANSRINLNTVNGRVSLIIPSDSNATVKADSLNGNITNDFGLPVRKGKYVGRDLHGRLGGGQVPIKLNSVNGQLSIAHRNDGKGLSPATNLLRQKSDDEDWDDADKDMTRRDNETMNRDIEKAVRDSQKVAAGALKEAQRELSKIDMKELSKLKIDIDAAKVDEQVRESFRLQRETLGRMDDIRWAGAVPTISKRSNSFAVKGIPKVFIDAKGCDVKVRGWDKQEVQYTLTDSSDRRFRTPVDIEENASSGDVKLRVPNVARAGDRPFPVGDFANVRLEVFVPRKSNLTITTDGEIRLDGVSGEIDLNGEDESINIRDVGGSLKVVAADGQVRIVGFTGALESTTADGDVYLEGKFSKLNAKSSDGTVTLTVSENSNLSLTSNTDVDADGLKLTRSNETLWQLGAGGERYNFVFSNGNLIVRNAALLSSF